MAISPNSTILSRRTAIAAGIAMLSTTPAVALASIATGYADAELIELGKQLDTTSMQLTDAYARSEKLYETYKAVVPPFPDVLRARPEDLKFNLPKATDKRNPVFYTTFDLHDLQRHKASKIVEIPIAKYTRDFLKDSGQAVAILYGEDDVVRKSVQWPEAQHRLDEIVTAIERWKTEDERIAASFGCTENEAEIGALQDRKAELFDAILQLQATTLAGLMVKALAVKHIHDDEDEVDLGDATDDQLAASVLNDLLVGALTPMNEPPEFQLRKSSVHHLFR